MTVIVGFQGLGQRNWAKLFQVPAIQEKIIWGNNLLEQHGIQVEDRPLNLVDACQNNGLVLQAHSQTCWQQPCIFLASMAYWELWREQHPNTDPLLLGFSFGEWTGATAAGCFDEETGLLLATWRGIFTSRAGGSSLLIRAKNAPLPIRHLQFRCKRIGGIWLANINSAFQGLVSGNVSQLEILQAYLKTHHPELITKLYYVGGAFHTPFLRNPQKQFGKWLNTILFHEPSLSLMLNATREVTRDPKRIKDMLLRQLSARLNFKTLAQKLPRDMEFHELCLEGPIMTGLIQQTVRAKNKERVKSLALHPFSA